MSFLIDLNNLKNDIMTETDFENQVKVFCMGILDIYNLTRVVYYRPLENKYLHALIEFVKDNSGVKVLETEQVRSRFNPARQISSSEEMYLATAKGYFIKIKKTLADHENSFLLICIKDEDGNPKGYIKIEKDFDDEKDLSSIDQSCNNGILVNEKMLSELFTKRRKTLIGFREIAEEIEEVAGFITLGCVGDPYCEINKDLYSNKRLASFNNLLDRIKTTTPTNRFSYIPEVINILAANSVKLYSIGANLQEKKIYGANPIVRAVGTWSSASDMPDAIYESSFMEGSRIINKADPMYFALLRGWDIVLDVAHNQKCLASKFVDTSITEDLSNITSCIVFRLDNELNKPIGFLRIDYIFRSDMNYLSRDKKLESDIQFIRALVPYLTHIPDADDFNYNPGELIKSLTKILAFENREIHDPSLLLNIVKNYLNRNVCILNELNNSDVIETIERLSFFVSDKNIVIELFKLLYENVDYRCKALIVHSIIVIYEFCMALHGHKIIGFGRQCYNDLSEWTDSKIMTIIGDCSTSKYDIKFQKDISDLFERLLQLKCLFIAKSHSKKLASYSIQYNKKEYRRDRANFIISIFDRSSRIPLSLKQELFKSLYYLVSNKLLDNFDTLKVITICIIAITENDMDSVLFGHALSICALIFNSRDFYNVHAISYYIDTLILFSKNTLAYSNNWHTIYAATHLLLVTSSLSNNNSIDIVIFEEYIIGDTTRTNMVSHAVLSAVKDYLLTSIGSSPNYIEDMTLKVNIINIQNTIRLLLLKIKSAGNEILCIIKEIMLFLGNHISSYGTDSVKVIENYLSDIDDELDDDQRIIVPGGFVSTLINELSCGNYDYKIAIHDMLYSLKTRRIQNQTIEQKQHANFLYHDVTGSLLAYDVPYITAVSSTLGFSPYDIGDKGYHLVEILGQCHIPVFLLMKTRAYENFISHNRLNQKIIEKLNGIKFSVEAGLEERILRAGTAIQELILGGEMPEHMQVEFIDKFSKFKRLIERYPAKDFVTIGLRSTAKGEDGRLYSYAGQFLTILNVKRADKFLTAVKRIWASLWSPKAISYRHDSIEMDPKMSEQFSYENIGMGIVIQGVVDSATSGVMMTLNDGGLVVSGSYGIEGGTRSDIAADRYVMDFHAALAEKVISQQQVAIIWNEGARRFIKQPIASEKQMIQKVSDDHLKILFEISNRLKNLPIFVGIPLDIEYTISKESTIFITQIRPKTALISCEYSNSIVTGNADSHKNWRASDASNEFYLLKDKPLQTFSIGVAKGRTVIVKGDMESSTIGLNRIYEGAIIVAKHLDVPNLEIYLKRRPPAAIIVETCSPFAHPVLVVNEMERRGYRIPIVQLPNGVSIFKEGVEIVVEVIKENMVSFYCRDKNILDMIAAAPEPIVIEISENRTAKSNFFYATIAEHLKSYEEIECKVLQENSTEYLAGPMDRIEIFRDLFFLKMYLRFKLEEFIEKQRNIDEEICSEWYVNLLRIFATSYASENLPTHNTKYDLFKSIKLIKYINEDAIVLVENMAMRAARIDEFLRNSANNIMLHGLWHPGILLFCANDPVFLLDPVSDCKDSICDPFATDFNPWSIDVVSGAQHLVLHDQLGVLVPHALKDRYIRGRIIGDPSLPDSAMDIGFLDNTGRYYKSFRERIDSLSKTAQILIRFGVNSAIRVEILPRMTEDFSAYGIKRNVTLVELSELY